MGKQMELFRETTKIVKYETAKEFVMESSMTKEDFLLCSRSVFDRYFKEYEPKACVHFKDEYGSGEPTDVMIEKLRADFEKSGCKRIIAVGGGAIIDMAKILVTGIPQTADAVSIFKKEVEITKKYPLIAVPATCGAGSEVSSVSIMEATSLHTKLGLADPALFPDEAVLIPELLRELPYFFFATSAIDALIHAMESYVSPKANLYTEMFSEKAIDLLIRGFLRMTEEGKEARMEMLDEFLTASNLAGIAFANAGTGAVHAMSYPLSGTYHVTHGEANYQFLTAVFQTYQTCRPNGKIRQLTKMLGNVLGCREEDVFKKLEELLSGIIPRKPLREYGMKEEEIHSFSVSVQESQKRLLGQSYIWFTKEQMEDIYRSLY